MEDSPELRAVQRGWYYRASLPGAPRPAPSSVLAPDGRWLTRSPHGWPLQVLVRDLSGCGLPRAALLRVVATLGRILEPLSQRPSVEVLLQPAGTPCGWERGPEGDVVQLDGAWLSACASPEALEAELRPLLPGEPALQQPAPPGPAPLESSGQAHVLFFESLMNTEMEHNRKEISQGVLHMVSALQGSQARISLAQVKMHISGEERPVEGLESLAELLKGPPLSLVCITLLEGYYEGAVALIRELRRLGCRARIAVGGVMPSLTPEHVAAHLEEVSFVCRGAGEYFLPRLVSICGDSSVDEPFTSAQRSALLAMEGLIALQGGEEPLLISAGSDRTVAVESLDALPLDLSRLEARHIEGGIEISTSRGCIHRCSFCSILGRESYQARSAEGSLELLRRYQQRFQELFGEAVPQNAWRVHISDDDFACDRDRAARFFRDLLDTPFRLSSVQVSVADLCRREEGRLLPELDPQLLEAIQPQCFADAHRPIPQDQHIHDQGPRRWSSYLQLGVETFSERELVRLAKGYRRVHIRAVASELDHRGLHMDAYFIQSNSETRAEDLLESLIELCRLKLRHPVHFHLRFPAVPHLVSYFPAATHRRKMRQGKADSMEVRRWLRAEGHSELDYPLVQRDLPGDPWVAAAVEAGFLQEGRRYLSSAERLRAIWLGRTESLPEGAERRAGERLLRALDDLPRRLCFQLLSQARAAGRGAPLPEWPGPPPDETRALSTALEVLGPRSGWLPAYKRTTHQELPRLVVIPTWQCELRCRYCYIPKQSGRVMSPEVLERSIDLLLSSDQSALILQFFGGEALLEYSLLQHGIRYGHTLAEERGKALQFIISSNGWSLDEEKLRWLSDYPVKLELSLDGDPETQNRFRRALQRGRDSYEHGIAPRAEAILRSGLPYDVIMVVHPANVEQMPHNFFHIAGLGFRRIQINFALGSRWTEDQQRAFAQGLFEIGARLRERWAAGEELTFINLENRPMPIRLNGEITVDWDGAVYGGNAFLHETEHKEKFVLGHLDDLSHFDRYWMDMLDNDFLLEWSYRPDITRNNLQVGRIFNSFLRWMQAQGGGDSSLKETRAR